MMAEQRGISKSVVDHFIALWRRARLSSDAGSLGLAGDGLLGDVVQKGPDGVAGSRGATPPLSEFVTDADRVQRIVDRMPEEIRTAFEAYHLALIRGERCKNDPHAARALILGISRPTYYRRVEFGWTIVRDHVQCWLDG